MSTQVGPFPFVSMQRILRAYAPVGDGSSRGRFQYLRRRGVVSPGVRKPIHGTRGRVRGTLHLYSELNCQAVRLYRRGELEGAHSVAEAAAKLEGAPAFTELVSRLAEDDALAPPEGEFAWADMARLMSDRSAANLLRETAGSLAAVQAQFRDMHSDTLRGVIRSINPTSALLDTAFGSMRVSARQLSEAHLNYVGIAVELQREMLDNRTSLLTAMPAVVLSGNAPKVQQDPDQAWFWTDRWQQMEREVDELVKAGRVIRSDTLDDLFADLDSHLDK